MARDRPSAAIVRSCVVVVALLAVSLRAEDPGLAWAEGLLAGANVSTAPADLVGWLRDRLPNRDFRERVELEVAGLRSRDFEVRAESTRRLVELGPAVVPRLSRLAADPDPEVVARAGRIVRRLRNGRHDPLAESLVVAALRLLRERPDPEIVPILLDAMPFVPNGPIRDAASEVVWRSVGPDHRRFVDRAARWTEPDPVAVVALERLVGAEAVPRLERLLVAADEELRLAAVRALLDRRPERALKTLFGLVDEAKDEDVRRRARTLLRIAVGPERLWPQPGNRNAELRTLADRLRETPLADARWMVDEWETVYSESFTTDDTTNVDRGFGRLQLESKEPVVARVDRGALRIPPAGTSDCDTRLALDLATLFVDEPPAHLRVVTELGSDGNQPVAWHPALSIGRAKILFHPGYSGGAFRIEDVESHTYHTRGNVSMGFVPRTNVFHRMTVVVESHANGDRGLRVSVRDPDRPEDHFEFGTNPTDEFRLTAGIAGPLDRIGLERSGRGGGEAMFRSLAVQVHRLDWGPFEW